MQNQFLYLTYMFEKWHWLVASKYHINKKGTELIRCRFDFDYTNIKFALTEIHQNSHFCLPVLHTCTYHQCIIEYDWLQQGKFLTLYFTYMLQQHHFSCLLRSFSYYHRQNIWNKLEGSWKTGQDEKKFEISACVIFDHYHQYFISEKEAWVWRYVTTQF